MNSPGQEAASPLATAIEPAADPSGEHARELLDYLIERAWKELLRTLPEPGNDNHPAKERAE